MQELLERIKIYEEWIENDDSLISEDKKWVAWFDEDRTVNFAPVNQQLFFCVIGSGKSKKDAAKNLLDSLNDKIQELERLRKELEVELKG